MTFRHKMSFVSPLGSEPLSGGQQWVSCTLIGGIARNAATSLLQVKRVHDASKASIAEVRSLEALCPFSSQATAAAAASTAPPSSAGESEPSAGSPPEPTPEEVAQTAAAAGNLRTHRKQDRKTHVLLEVEKALDEALPLFLQTAWVTKLH